MNTMTPELKAYLDKLRAEPKALYDAWDNQFELRATLPTTGAPTPPPTRSAVVTSDGGLTVDATAVAAVPDVSCSTTKAQDVLEGIHDASPGYITMTPVTCSTDCSNQVVATDIVNEVHDVNEVRDAASTVYPEHAVNLSHKEVAQLIVHGDKAAPTLNRCSTKCPLRNTNLLRPSPWPSFRPLSVTSYPEEPCSSIHSQSHGGSCFSPWLVRLMFRDVHREESGNGTDSVRPCTNRIQHKVPESFTENGSRAVAYPTEREDCLEEYRDASSFIHHSHPGDAAAIARESDVPVEIKKLDKGSVGSSVAAYVLSLERYGTCKYQFSRESSMTDFPAESEVENEAEYYVGNTTPGLVGREDDLNLQSTDGCSAGIDSNNTVVVADSKSDKTSDRCEFIGDLNSSSLQKCPLLLSDPEYQSACSRKVGSFFKDVMEVLDSMSEVSPRGEIVEPYPIRSETISNSGDELKLIHNENTPTDCSTMCSSQNLSVQLPVDNSCLVNSVCSVPGYQDDLAVTNVDDMLKPMIYGAVPGLVFHYAPYKVILLLPWCAKFLSIKPCQLLLDKGYLKCHITLGEINSKMLQSLVVQYVQAANSIPGYLNSCAVSAASYCGHGHSFTQFKRLWAPRTKEEVFGQMWSEPLFHAFCCPWDACDKQWNSEGHHKQYVNLLVLLVYSTVEHIHSLQFRCNAKSCPPIAQILNESQVLECASPVASNFIQRDSSCCCFFLATCAPCVRDQPKVNSSTSTSALTSPLAQQLDSNFGVESIFELLLHILRQTSCSKFTPADHNLDKHNSETANHRTSTSVVHNSNKFTCTCYMCLGIPLVDNRTPLLELELLITPPGEHFPLLQPKPPWSPLFPPKIPTEFRSYMRTNSAFLRLPGVLWELTQSWTFTDHVSTLSSYWWCFSWGPDAGLITTLFWLAHIIAEKLQEEMPCISESSTTCGGLHAMRSIMGSRRI